MTAADLLCCLLHPQGPGIAISHPLIGIDMHSLSLSFPSLGSLPDPRGRTESLVRHNQSDASV